MEPCFLIIFTLFSKKRTKGFAIMEITHPTTKGIKNISSFGKRKQKHKMVARATIKLTNIFKYFVDCFILPLLSPAAPALHRQQKAGRRFPIIPYALLHKQLLIPLLSHYKLPAACPELTADGSSPAPLQKAGHLLPSYLPPESDGIQTEFPQAR